MDSKRNKWINAVKELLKNPEEIIYCPECENGVLTVKDVLFDSNKKKDRYLICSGCGRMNVVTFNTPAEENNKQ